MFAVNHRALLIATVVAASSVRVGSAQVDTAACAQSAQRARMASSTQNFRAAFHALHKCPDHLAAFLADAWTSARPDTARLRLLVVETGLYQDERVFTALLATLGNDAQPRQLRINAANGLIMQVCPGRALGEVDLLPGKDSANSIVMLSAVTEVTGVPGGRAVQGQPLERFLNALQDVSTSSVDLNMRLFARAVTRSFAMDRKAGLRC